MKKTLDSVFFTPDVCVEAPQTSCDPIGEIVFTNFSSGVSAQERFDMSGRVKNRQWGFTARQQNNRQEENETDEDSDLYRKRRRRKDKYRGVDSSKDREDG